jgi:hypothetical protein
MKKCHLIFSFILSILASSPFDSYGQFILAGQHSPGNYFVDINPDTTLTGPNDHFATNPAAVFPIDIDGDGTNEFLLYARGSWVNGWGDSEISIRIYDTTSCQVAFGYVDTCHTPNSTYFLYKIAKSLRNYDTIGDNLTWVRTKLFLTYTDWAVMAYNCDHNGFVNDPLGNYIAVRKIRSNDTLYGWIKVSNINFLTYTVQEFASNRDITGIKEDSVPVRFFPNPTSGVVTIETGFPVSDLVVYNQFGIQVMSRKNNPKSARIDLSGMPCGIYVFKLITGNSSFVKKILKL